MIITNPNKNSMPEQVQENLENIKVLEEAIGKINAGVRVGKNLWANPDSKLAFENQVITNEEFLNPYNTIKIYYIINIDAPKVKIQSVEFDIDVNYPIEVEFINGSQLYKRSFEFNTLRKEIIVSDEKVVDILTGEETTGNNRHLVPLGMNGFIEEVRL